MNSDMEVKELQSRIEGKVTAAMDEGHENLRREMKASEFVTRGVFIS
jgi:hypothetical protein